MVQPGLLKIGTQFYVKVDNIGILLPSTVINIEEAIGHLIAYIYVLNLKYPESLKFVFGFFEHLGTPSSESIKSFVHKLATV